jgi:predicted nuclease of predicted toxin-antitoxin system
MLDFLLDENMPLSVASTLEDQGYRARHVADMGLGGSPDETIFDRAQAEGWIIASRDLGFGSLLDYPLGTHVGNCRRAGTLHLFRGANLQCC